MHDPSVCLSFGPAVQNFGAAVPEEDGRVHGSNEDGVGREVQQCGLAADRLTGASVLDDDRRARGFLLEQQALAGRTREPSRDAALDNRQTRLDRLQIRRC